MSSRDVSVVCNDDDFLRWTLHVTLTSQFLKTCTVNRKIRTSEKLFVEQNKEYDVTLLLSPTHLNVMLLLL